MCKADSQHAQPRVLGDVVRGASVYVKVVEYGHVEYKVWMEPYDMSAVTTAITQTTNDRRFKAKPIDEQLSERRVAHFLAYALDHAVHFIVYFLPVWSPLAGSS